MPSIDPQTNSSVQAPPPDAGAEPIPDQVGRYRILASLGSGSLSVVYRGRDEALQRDVAIKVPHRRYLASPKAIELFLAEARILASLDHPGIVPVYDTGTQDGYCYLVAKLFAGSDLATRLAAGKLTAAAAVAILIPVAEALHHAHRRGLVHRDVKPGNILFDDANQPIVVDFGLALRETDVGTGPVFVGTVPYMSPEQANREGHRVDPRSDIWGLGVILYEMLTGRRPFGGRTQEETLELIRTQEPRPPRQLDDTVPRELSRICLKALAKRLADRYETARDLADDLRLWQTGAAPSAAPVSAVTAMVPRGLRSFEAEDRDYFLRLLPGARDRDGLPESVAFWKARLESHDARMAFSVGVLYGPSGCGKSSLVKAALLPRLADAVIALYLEATPDQTEAHLLQSLRRQFPDLPADQDLTQSLESLRLGRGAPPEKKVVLVLDQFEQWLHANLKSQTELARALRQCDGVHLQCLLMIRDDFWLPLARFLHEVEAPLLEGHDIALVDLFSPQHARKVLAEIGQAYGRLPATELSVDQERFLTLAIAALTDQGKIVPVRLSLFAEMVKDRPWVPETLQSMGGIEGIGVSFLEESFLADNHRRHEAAARAVLQALLPAQQSELKGKLRSRPHLLEASGYEAQQFEELMRILDQELRLVTPTSQGDPEGAAQSYQLTHDFLVPALRQWLTDKQRESPQGRAGLRLAEYAVSWNGRPQKRRLPNFWEWLTIRLYTGRKNWDDAQCKMMAQASRHHLVHIGVAAGLLGLLVAAGLFIRAAVIEERNQAHADSLVAFVQTLHESQLAHLSTEVLQYRTWTVPKLRALIADPDTNEDDRIHARLVLLPIDPGQLGPIRQAALTAEPREFLEIRRALLPYQDQFVKELWAELENPQADAQKRVRFACLLALFAPRDPRWQTLGPAIVELLLKQDPLYLFGWVECLRPVRQQLIPPLLTWFRNPEHPYYRLIATSILGEYTADDPELFGKLLKEADNHQQALLLLRVKYAMKKEK